MNLGFGRTAAADHRAPGVKGCESCCGISWEPCGQVLSARARSARRIDARPQLSAAERKARELRKIEEARVGLGRIVALYCRSSSLYQIR